MKILYFLIALLSISTTAQDITGKWHGVLEVQGMQLVLSFDIEKTDSGFISTMDSPDQGAVGIPVDETTFSNSEIILNAPNLGVKYVGVLGSDNIISGNFKQGGMTVPLNLSREKMEKKISKRPQNPSEPFPYHSEDITFKNIKANIELAGTLTLPNTTGIFPVVVLISGSGPQDRNEEILKHKPFLVISDYLTKNGIGVLRFDDRGTALSTGDFASANSADFATDVEAAVAYLKTRKEVNKNQIGLIGHSEGGMIAPMVASKDKDVAFIILLAGTAIPGDEFLLLQQKHLLEAMKTTKDVKLAMTNLNKNAFKIVKNSTDKSTLQQELLKVIKLDFENIFKAQGLEENIDESIINAQVQQLMSPWMQFFIKYDPAPTLSKVKCPVLALNGSKDLQVPADENLSAIRNALTRGGNKRFTIKELPGLNHLFQECHTGLPDEYGEIEETFSPLALADILSWIKLQIN